MSSLQDLSFTTADNIPIFAEGILVEEPKAGIVFVHGLGEHFGRYGHVVDAFEKAGYSCFGYDRRGHGRSGGKRGHTPSYDAFLEEIDQLVAEIRMIEPDLPLIMYGHSLGGNIGLYYVLDSEADFIGAVISAPFIRLAFQPSKILLSIANVAASVMPTFTQKNGLDVHMLSRDSRVVQAYVNDDLVHPYITAKKAKEIFKAAAELDAYEGSAAVPILLMHGTSDQINDHHASRDFARRIGSQIKYQEWLGFYHELHNEPERAAVIAYVIDWCDATVKQYEESLIDNK